MSVPKLLQYSDVKPRGVTTEYKSMRFTPLTSFNNYITNDIVRFWIPMIKGFWDPYKSYIEIEVEVADADFPYGTAIQVDNSASSFINEMTIYADSKEIERIQEYDTVAALLHDVMYTPSDKFGKEYEGTGYMSHNSHGFCTDSRQTTSTSIGTTRQTYRYQDNWNGAVTSVDAIASLGYYTSGYNPARPTYIDYMQSMYGFVTGLSAEISGTGVQAAPYPSRTPSPIYNIYYQVGATEPGGRNSHLKTTPPAVRYAYELDNAGYCQYAPASSVAGEVKPLDANVFSPRPYVEAVYESSCYGLQGSTAYNFMLYDYLAYTTPGNAGTNTAWLSAPYVTPNYNNSQVQYNGYSQAFSQELSNGSNQPLFAPAHGQTWIHNGAFLPRPQATRQRVFQIPLISSLMGVLIPAQSYKLIPMEALQNLMIEFRLNEYAMFTSGYAENFVHDASNTTNRNTTPMSAYAQLQRQWKINKIEIWGAIYQFDDFVSGMVLQQLSAGGIALSSNGWALGPRFSLSNTSLLKNSWQINAGYESLKTLVFRIQSDDYKRYSFCRKHYYLSGNVSSLQLKISNTYIPPQPIQGHAGNILPVGNEKSNSPFIIQLHKTFGKLFNIGANMYINSSNFAVNDRPYNPTNILPYVNVISEMNSAITNNDTATGLPLFHENRCVGRAVYAFDLEALPGEPDIISGLNTLKWRPFEVMVDVDTVASSFSRDSTLVFLLNHDVIYILKNGEAPEVLGKG